MLHDQIPLTKVSKLIDQKNHRWNLTQIVQVFSPDTIKRILQTPIRWTFGKDELWWPHTSNGSFSVKSTYLAIRSLSVAQQPGPSTS